MSGILLTDPMDNRSAAYFKKVAENIGYKGFKYSSWEAPEDVDNLHKVVDETQIGEELSYTAMYFDHPPTESEIETARQLVNARFYFAGKSPAYQDGTHWLDFEGSIPEKISAFDEYFEGDPVD